MSEEQLITQDDIDALKERDSRWKDIELAVKIEQELKDSPAVNLILEAITRQASEAMEKIIEADPTDQKRISALQAAIKYARFVGQSIDTVRKKGLLAHQELEQEGQVEIENAGSN